MYTYVKIQLLFYRIMKNIFITGISSGIGKNITEKLLNKGYVVHGSVRSDEDEIQLRKIFKKNLFIYRFDVTKSEEIISALSSFEENLQGARLNCLINNAGLAVPGPLYHLSDDEFYHQINVNLLGVRKVTNTFLPYLGYGDHSKINPGKIINISSVSGLFSTPFNGSYCISKHALESMTDVYRRELMPFGIDVIAVEPGPIKSEIWRKNIGAMEPYYDSPYGEILKKADTMIENAEKSALPAEIVSNKILEIIQSKNPKTRYLIHRKPLLFKILSRFLPDRFVDKLIWKNFSKNSYRPV